MACSKDNAEAEELRREQERWIESAFASASAQRGRPAAKHVVLLSHVTPFMGHEDEPQGHFNWEVEG